MAVMSIDRTADMPDDPQKLADVLRDLHDQLNPPEGYRVEIVEGEIVVSPSPFGKHALIIADIKRAASSSLPPSLELVERITLEEPELSRYEPDLGLWPRELLDTESAWVFPGNACAFVVEVTSPNQEHRDYAKAHGYARSGIPVYLLVDRASRVCVVFTEPEGDRYRNRHETPFGKPVTLPLGTPVTPVTLETTGF